MTGGWIEQYPDDVKAIAAAGHELGNHSENHNGAKYTAEALEQLIDGLQSKGFTLVKMSDLIYKDHYDINPEGRQQHIK